MAVVTISKITLLWQFHDDALPPIFQSCRHLPAVNEQGRLSRADYKVTAIFQHLDRNLVQPWARPTFIDWMIAFVSATVIGPTLTGRSSMGWRRLWVSSTGAGWFRISLKCWTHHRSCSSAVVKRRPSLPLIGTCLPLRAPVSSFLIAASCAFCPFHSIQSRLSWR